MATRYNLRSRRVCVKSAAPPVSPPDSPKEFDPAKYQLMLQELFPSKYMNRKLASLLPEESDSDSEYTTESESDDPSEVNIVVHLGDDDSDDSESDEEETTIMKEFKDLANRKSVSERAYLASLPETEQVALVDKLRAIGGYSVASKPPRIAVIESEMPDEYKAIALAKLTALKVARDSEYHKLKTWVDAFMMLPFNVICPLPVTIADGPIRCGEFLGQAKLTLDSSTYGLNDAKMQILQYLGQVIANPNAAGTAIAIKGPMGTGKTTLVKDGISKILGRPFAFIALGGATDSSSLEGHLITYEGSVWGQIATILMQCKCMNPVIYFDELDKVSETPKGDEIIGILTHLTDSSQNDKFQDKYFSEVYLDLSKAIFIFSYNDESKVNPILRDRMYTISTEGYTCAQKTVIATHFLSKSIRANVNFEESQVILSNEAVSYIIEHYTNHEKGVRNLKRCIETIYSKLNLFRLMEPGTNLFGADLSIKVEFPYTITVDTVRSLLKMDAASSHAHMYL